MSGLGPDAASERRAPWTRDGWRAEATEWIAESLAALGRPATGPIEEVRAWCLSCVLRISTAEGEVFFKATSDLPLFVDEGRVMRGLSQLFPANVPRPLAIETSRRWMLLDDHGQELGWGAPVEVREEVQRLFAGMQVESTRHLDELLAIGCIDRRPAWLANQVDELIADDAAVAALEDAEIARLRSLGPHLRALCQRLADGPVPDGLVHGDLHLSNVAKRNEQYVFFDWSDACVSNPLLDMLDIIREENERVRDAMRDLYLSAWIGFAPYDTLLELWRLAEPFAALNQALSYRSILANAETEADDDLEQWLPFFLRKALAADVLAEY